MQFVYPQFLYALGFIAVPIVIHLFNLVKPKVVVFSSIQFLKEVELKSSRKVKLKHFLILFSRIFFITALVFLFAQPIIPSPDSSDKNNSNHVSIYLDNSLSMSANFMDEQKMTYAINELNTILDKYPRGSKFQLIDNEFSPSSLFYFKKDKIKDMLTEVDLTTKVKSANEIYKRQQSLKKKNNIEDLDVIWISDFQKEIFNDLDLIEKDSSITHYMFKVGDSNQSNVFVDSVYLVNPFIKKDENTELRIVLKNSTNIDVSNLNVKIIVGENELANNSISINGNSKEEIEINFVLTNEGESRLLIEITNDDIEFDNEFYIRLNVENQLNILTITDSSTSLVAKVFDNEDMFKSDVVNSGAIDFNDLSKYDLIVLDHLYSIKKSLKVQLSEISSNTSIVVVPKREMDLNSYQSLFEKLNCAVIIKNNKDKSILAAPDFKNPFFKGVFEKEDSKINMPEITSVLSLFSASNNILKSQSGEVSLAEYSSNGKVYVFGTSLNQPQSTFLRHSLIVPLFYKMAMNSSSKNSNLYTTISGNLDNITISDTIKGAYSLSNNNFKFVPDQKIVNNKLSLNLSDADVDEGFYKLMKKDIHLQSIALNIAKEESNLSALTDEDIDFLNDANRADSSSSLSEQFEKMSVGVSLWRYFLYLALLFLMVEILLIRFYKS